MHPSNNWGTYCNVDIQRKIQGKVYLELHVLGKEMFWNIIQWDGVQEEFCWLKWMKKGPKINPWGTPILHTSEPKQTPVLSYQWNKTGTVITSLQFNISKQNVQNICDHITFLKLKMNRKIFLSVAQGFTLLYPCMVVMKWVKINKINTNVWNLCNSCIVFP